MTRKIIYQEIDDNVQLKVEVNLRLKEVLVIESVGTMHNWYEITYPQLFGMLPFMKDQIPQEDQ